MRKSKVNKSHFRIKELTTKRLLLRAFTKKDVSFVSKHFTSKSVTKYLYDKEPPTSNREIQELLKWLTDSNAKDHIRWSIALKEKPEVLIGTCGFHCYDNKNNAAEIGFDLSKEYWNKGYMSEALKKMITYGFNTLHLHKISAIVYVGNIRSKKLMGKLGFRLDGTIRDKHFFRGRYYDHNMYSLLKTEKARLSRK